MPPEVTKDFTLLSVSVIEVQEDSTRRQQHIVVAEFADEYLSSMRVESIPVMELIGRRITSLAFHEGRLVIGLSTKR